MFTYPTIFVEKCTVAKHHGEILLERIEKSKGVNKTALADAMGISRGTLYNLLEQAEIPWEYLHRAGKYLNYDFREDLPEMPVYRDDILRESQGEYVTMTQCIEDVKAWKNKYIALAEEHFELSKKYSRLLESRT